MTCKKVPKLEKNMYIVDLCPAYDAPMFPKNDGWKSPHTVWKAPYSVQIFCLFLALVWFFDPETVAIFLDMRTL